jgi:fumarate hydratase class I
LEQLETNPAKYLPEVDESKLGGEVIKINLDQPMEAIRKQLSKYPIKTRLSLTGTMVVARDIAHAKLKERLDRGDGMPEYMMNHPVYYAGPAKTPQVIGSNSPF